jgi:hypothetical protein
LDADPPAQGIRIARRNTTCDRCGKDRMLSETYTPQRDMLIREILAKMRHDGCGGRAGRVELLTGIEGASSRPVRKIVLTKGR